MTEIHVWKNEEVVDRLKSLSDEQLKDCTEKLFQCFEDLHLKNLDVDRETGRKLFMYKHECKLLVGWLLSLITELRN